MPSTSLTPARKRLHGSTVTVPDTRQEGPGDWDDYRRVLVMDRWIQEGKWHSGDGGFLYGFNVLMVIQGRREHHDFCYQDAS